VTGGPAGNTRRRTVTWADPMVSAAAARELSGLDFLSRLAAGELPPMPMADLVGFRLARVELGLVVFEGAPGEYLYNPIGAVHGGFACTLLDSCMGCAIHSALPAGFGYTTLELKVNLVRGIVAKTGPMHAEGRLIHGGRTTGTAEGKLTGEDGKIYAHGTTTCLIRKL
jgi:uncharacterized protein (TIGR00369 family)